MPKSMQINPNATLSSILHIDKTVTANVAAQLDATGVLGVAEAYISGWTMQDIAKALRGSVVAVVQWEHGLKKEDKNLLRIAKLSNLDQLENHLTKLMHSELVKHEETGEIDDDLKYAALADKRVQTIERVLKATQQQIERYMKKDEDESAGGTTIYNQIVVADRSMIPPMPTVPRDRLVE